MGWLSRYPRQPENPTWRASRLGSDDSQTAPLVPRSGSMATAMGFWSTATVPIVRVPIVMLGQELSLGVGESIVQSPMFIEMSVSSPMESLSALAHDR